jgi:hypothetical protein
MAPLQLIPLNNDEQLNLKALAKLMDEFDDNDLLMKAEILRELGCFENALALLSKVGDKDLEKAVSFIGALSKLGDPCVRKFQYE